jgi:hypothetical protein
MSSTEEREIETSDLRRRRYKEKQHEKTKMKDKPKKINTRKNKG